ncbi:pyridoxal-dependent decarboxylase [Allokutzneria sp. A3M-2-11 16]|uniref:pyridoxal phosphate-dependent decarboxylase family protein n=1 Tax=Allokutzneria sp. A3M-2-11 16 TaxID=2962043 RepID=UPI0020B6605F|nr:pyridoxal-dependent decarboxylase [Allokutzneria sp. A3M-2-11 16]MCP3802669.1 pyridoxal-dependent decarboxylase [Allokutzneria sp. A3M-2-11 16]
MPPFPDESLELLELVASYQQKLLTAPPDALVRPEATESGLPPGDLALPEHGLGAAEAVTELSERLLETAIRSAGPRFFHFVIGGVTPAALAADMLTSTADQNTGMWVSSPIGAHTEVLALRWLRELFGLPAAWSGVLTSGATMANFVGLASARRWWGAKHGVDVDVEGLSGLPRVPVLASGHLHSSAVKSLGMLGIGRSSVRFHRREDGSVDLAGMRADLASLGGAPAIISASAGEVNAGAFDPISELADLAEEFGAWLHVDGAFGLFAAVSERTRHLVAGVERANSVGSDGHKWLNVPYDCGFAFVRHPELLGPIFTNTAAYLPGVELERPNYGNLGPESSRRARAFAVWATLAAYGRSGYRRMVERHLDLAQQLAERVRREPSLELLADVPLNIVCFRYHPDDVAENELDALNSAIAEAVITDGRVHFGSTTHRGMVAFRPAIVNWRTGPADIDLIVEVVLDLAERVRQVGP